MIRCVSPIDGSLYLEREEPTASRIDEAVTRACRAAEEWRRVPLAERCARAGRLVDAFVAHPAHAEELAWQMGRPVAHGPGEIRGFEERARCMIELAEAALADRRLPDRPGFVRFIRREPLGVWLAIAPWNYPYLTAVNSVLPALVAGNAVLLKHSDQTPLCAERFVEAGRAAGLPEGLFDFLHLSREATAALIARPEIGGVAFTGSVPGGVAVERAAVGRFVPVGLELGGKDPAYVRPDADLAQAVEGLADGSFFNAGQSCCGVERIYVHAEVYDAFVEGLVAAAQGYVLGDPRDPQTTLGPLVRPEAADFVRGQVAEAVAAGARALVDPGRFPAAREGSAYLAPQVLVEVDHRMRVMTEESFGPVVGVMRVASDDEAIARMNDSAFGLTASLWSRDLDAALPLGDRIQAGTVFLNRCDYLDPELAWTGVKDSGRGQTLSTLGYDALTRPKSFHYRLP